MTWRRQTRAYGGGAVLTLLVALALLAQSYRVDARARAAQRDAETRGVIVPGVVEVSLGAADQRQTYVQVDVQGVKRAALIFDPDHPIVRDMIVRVAWVPSDPVHVYIVGERPWTWWASMSRLWGVIAGISGVVALISLLFDLMFSPLRS